MRERVGPFLRNPRRVAFSSGVLAAAFFSGCVDSDAPDNKVSTPT
ncbi:MAG: hypothetical protein NUV69_01190 [Candidatus Curtissbacteria bacterium]|nr:hypothetical protein [Candidatus Curtissbacteria bacterium]